MYGGIKISKGEYDENVKRAEKENAKNPEDLKREKERLAKEYKTPTKNPKKPFTAKESSEYKPVPSVDNKPKDEKK
jgi:hypothetical protein